MSRADEHPQYHKHTSWGRAASLNHQGTACDITNGFSALIKHMTEEEPYAFNIIQMYNNLLILIIFIHEEYQATR